MDVTTLNRSIIGNVVLLSSLLFATAITPVAAQPSSCTFVLGFAAMHDALPDVVGNCVADQTYNPVNGDGLQSTTNGLLVWRKADNLTAFTNGFQSWVDGPFGIQVRFEDQRFDWEPNPDHLAITPTPTAGDRCHTAGLSLSLMDEEPGAGNVFATFLFTNQLDVSCSFFGYPGAQMWDTDGNPLPTDVVRGGGQLSNQGPPQTITVPAHAAAQFLIHWGQVPVDNEPTCPESASLSVIPPDEYYALSIPITIHACRHGRLDISPVQAVQSH